ncbi:helix-turn-helix domain-containing protein [Chloroflexota bacterium]
MKRQRAQKMARLFIDKGKGIKELALTFGVSQRTVQRALKSYLSTSSHQSPSPY